jgi:hypothetical protein
MKLSSRLIVKLQRSVTIGNPLAHFQFDSSFENTLVLEMKTDIPEIFLLRRSTPEATQSGNPEKQASFNKLRRITPKRLKGRPSASSSCLAALAPYLLPSLWLRRLLHLIRPLRNPPLPTAIRRHARLRGRIAS